MSGRQRLTPLPTLVGVMDLGACTTAADGRSAWCTVGVLVGELVAAFAVGLLHRSAVGVLTSGDRLQMVWSHAILVLASRPDMIQFKPLRDRSDEQLVGESVGHDAGVMRDGEHAVAAGDQPSSPEPAGVGLDDEGPEALFCRATRVVRRAVHSETVIVLCAEARVVRDGKVGALLNSTRRHRCCPPPCVVHAAPSSRHVEHRFGTVGFDARGHRSTPGAGCVHVAHPVPSRRLLTARVTAYRHAEMVTLGGFAWW